MKRLQNILVVLTLSIFVYVGCTPEKYELGSIDVTSDELVEGIAYKIEHDTDNPNIVYLTSLMDSKYQPLWNHPQGRSQKSTVTLKMPFAGSYDVQFGVQTRGGYVYGDTVQFTIDDMYPGFIEDELWTFVSGGIDKSKTWYLDLDSEETSRFFMGPMWFFTSTYEWDNLHNLAGGNYIDSDDWKAENAIVPNMTNGEATWYWTADWAGNQWMCAAADFGTMTFDLKGGAHVVVDQSAYSSDIAGGKVQNGTYMLDSEKHTISFTDAYPLHVIERTESVTTSTEFRILYADSAKMQIMTVPGGECFNYISEEYRDNWKPDEGDGNGGDEGDGGYDGSDVVLGDATDIPFDNTKLVFGDLEDKGNLRLELYNEYGSTVSDPPFAKENLVTNQRVEVTFTLSGITFIDGAAASYKTMFSWADADWNPQYWGDGTREKVANITGDGTYTIFYDPESLAEGATVFVIDIEGMAAEIVDLSAVTATVDKLTVYNN
nr:hypothetical protein [uncultured Carboxylicivirga sp.]